MSYASSKLIVSMLIQEKADLELPMLFLMQHKAWLGNAVKNLISTGEEYEPGSQADRILQAHMNKLHEAEKLLDLRIDDLQRRLKVVESRLQDAKEMANKAAENFTGSK